MKRLRCYSYNVNYFIIETPSESAIQQLTNKQFSVYPNPVKGKLSLKSSDFQMVEIAIMDLVGNTIFHESTVNEPELQLSPNMPDGIYIVRVSNGKQSLFTKIVKSNN